MTRPLILLALAYVALGGLGRAADVYKVAGSGFNAAVRGTPVTWRNGVLRYWTDQGALNSNISGSDADQAVADALLHWTQVPTAALTAQRAGQLAEDVSGANVSRVNGVLVFPADAQAGANGESLTVIYDSDGAITDLYYGPGASDPVECATNAVIYYVDAYAPDAHFAHAVLVVNGNCFTSTVDLEYTLVRAFGRLLGVGWSQINDNVVTGVPPAVSADYAGYPRMHPLDGWCVSNCFYDSALRADDVAAVSRLYPVTAGNIAQYPANSKTLFRETTVRISGRVLFASGAGMQGVNVVARWIDPNTGRPSRVAAASCVSGFLYRGNAGNGISGFADTAGQRYDNFGGGDPALAGYYEIAGLPLPAGQSQASYQISVEAVNPLYTEGLVVGPYELMAPSPSGSFAPVVVGPVGAGADMAFDINMQGSSGAPRFKAVVSQQDKPASLARSGMWASNMAAYGRTDFLSFFAKANRSFSVEVTALDENSHATQSKLAPVIGVWNSTDPVGGPSVVTVGPFDSVATGVTRLNAVTSADDQITLGVADLRGDGRPDYSYVARVFYGDTVQPARAASGQGTVTITGMGFTSSATVLIGGVAAMVKAVSATRMVVAVPALAEGVYDVGLRDSVTGAIADLFQVLQIGDAAATVSLVSTPPIGTVAVGSVTGQAMRVRVLGSDGNPLAGEAVVFRALAAGASLTACGASQCTVLTNQAGEAQTGALISVAGVNTVTASLQNGSSVSVTYTGATQAYSVTALLSEQWVVGAGVLLPAEVMHNGTALANTAVVFNPGAATMVSDKNGLATEQMSIPGAQPGVDLTVNACAQVQGNPCGQFLVHQVDGSSLQVRVLQGNGQSITPGSAAVPIVFQAVDGAGHPVYGAAVTCTIVAYTAASSVGGSGGESHSNQGGSPKLMKQESLQLVSASDGTVAVTLGSAYLSANLDVQVTAVLPDGAAVQAAVRVRTVI